VLGELPEMPAKPEASAVREPARVELPAEHPFAAGSADQRTPEARVPLPVVKGALRGGFQGEELFEAIASLREGEQLPEHREVAFEPARHEQALLEHRPLRIPVGTRFRAELGTDRFVKRQRLAGIDAEEDADLGVREHAEGGALELEEPRLRRD
jgi:hypothetical protein